MFQNVLRNSKILFSTEMANLVTGIAIVVLLARLLNVSALGLYSFSFALGSVLGIFCLSGANQWITREIARDPSRLGSIVGHSLVTRTAIGVILLAVMELVFLWMGYSKQRMEIITFLVMVRITECMILMLCACFRGFEEMRFERRIRICLNAANVCISIPVLVFTRSLFAFSMTQLCLSFIVLIVAYQILVGRYAAKPFENISPSGCVDLFKQGIDFSIYMILLIVYLQTNTILLTFFCGNEATGLYTAGFRFVSALGFIAASMVGALFPVISRMNLTDHAEEIKKAYLRSTKYLMVMSSFFSLTLFIFAPNLIALLYGKHFLPATIGLRIMAFSVMFSYMNSSSANLMFSMNRERQSIRILGVCVVFVIVSNLIFIPKWGFVGASLTTLLPELLNFALQYKAISSYLPNIGLLTVLLKFVVLSLGVAWATLAWTTMSLPFRVGLFLILYAAGVYALRIFQPDEAAFIKNRYGPRKAVHA